MSEKWTKGPWYAEPQPNGTVVIWGGPAVDLGDGEGPLREIVADVAEQADAHLIAAAPLMAEALEAAEEYKDFVEAGGQGESAAHFANEVERLYKRAQELRRRALSAARGEG